MDRNQWPKWQVYDAAADMTGVQAPDVEKAALAAARSVYPDESITLTEITEYPQEGYTEFKVVDDQGVWIDTFNVYPAPADEF